MNFVQRFQAKLKESQEIMELSLLAEKEERKARELVSKDMVGAVGAWLRQGEAEEADSAGAGGGVEGDAGEVVAR